MEKVVSLPKTSSMPGACAIAAQSFGKGRVVVSADPMAFQPYRITTADNAALLVNVLGWLLDEPVTGLDPIATNEMYELIDSLNKSGISIIMISHDIHFAVEHASHILHIGKHVFFGTKDEYCSSDIGKMYLNLEEVE